MKQYILIRTDLGMGKGKMVAQGAHASVMVVYEALVSISAWTVVPDYLKQWKEWCNEWLLTNYKKIVLKCPNGKTLLDYYWQCKGCYPSFLVEDLGLTQIEPYTYTSLAIGPAPDEKLDPIFAGLKLL